MKTYVGHVLGRTLDWTVDVSDDDGVRPLEHHVHHSPDGFAWGYGGSGPSELARCMLWDLLGREPKPALYQQFKWDVIARLPQDSGWAMPAVEVQAWYDQNQDLEKLGPEVTEDA